MSWLDIDHQSVYGSKNDCVFIPENSAISKVHYRSNLSTIIKNTIKRTWKPEKPECLLCKGELDFEFLCKFDNNNVVPKFLNSHVINIHVKYNST